MLKLKDQTWHFIFLFIFGCFFVWSAINPKDFFTWVLEVLPAVIGLVVIMAYTGSSSLRGTQGDVWDTQWDMFLALCGAIISLLTLSSLHDNNLNAISKR